MTDDDLRLLYRWSREELQNGNRIKASRIHKIYDRFRKIRGDSSWSNGYITHIDNFDLLLALEDLKIKKDNQKETT
jgi:hypothetical protein